MCQNLFKGYKICGKLETVKMSNMPFAKVLSAYLLKILKFHEIYVIFKDPSVQNLKLQ